MENVNHRALSAAGCISHCIPQSSAYYYDMYAANGGKMVDIHIDVLESFGFVLVEGDVDSRQAISGDYFWGKFRLGCRLIILYAFEYCGATTFPEARGRLTHTRLRKLTVKWLLSF